MPRRTIDIEAGIDRKISDFAKKHPIYNGNYSAVVREALFVFFERKHKPTCAEEVGDE